MGRKQQPDERRLLTVLMGIGTTLTTQQPTAILPYEGGVTQQNFKLVFRMSIPLQLSQWKYSTSIPLLPSPPNIIDLVAVNGCTRIMLHS